MQQRNEGEVRAAGGAVRQRRRPMAAFLGAVSVATLLVSLIAAPGSQAAAPARVATAHASTPAYPVGVYDVYEPSGYAPPAPNQLPGYQQVFLDDFTKPLDTTKWGLFDGVPKGDPSGRFEPGHVRTSKGLLRIGTWRDPSHRNHWATGGVCLCGAPTTYGAFFVRSRVTAPGPDDAQLLWPVDNSWPPELDFNETGKSPMASSWTDHYASPTTWVQHTRKINVVHWHTWGIVWTPTSVTFVVDGKAWGQLTGKAQIPTLPMTLDLQSQTWCGILPECPRRSSAMLVDWVVAYTPLA